MNVSFRKYYIVVTYVILLLVSKQSLAALLGDMVTVDINGASITPQSFEVTSIGGAEATFTYGSDESVEIDADDTYFDLKFFDFTGVWQWSQDPFVIEFTDVDFPGGITHVDVIGTFFDNVALETQVISPTSFTVSVPASMAIQEAATEANARLVLSSVPRVPLPAAAWLMVSGLSGLTILAARRKRV